MERSTVLTRSTGGLSKLKWLLPIQYAHDNLQYFAAEALQNNNMKS
jgi:hypothetical protein